MIGYACIDIPLPSFSLESRLFWNWDNQWRSRGSTEEITGLSRRNDLRERETGKVQKSRILSDNFRRRKHGENPSPPPPPMIDQLSPLLLDRRPDIRRRAGNEIIAWNKRGNNFMPPRRLRRVAAPSRSIACLGHGERLRNHLFSVAIYAVYSRGL